MNCTKPYKNFTVLDVTQGFHSGHKAIDAVPKKLPYGKPLVAPEEIEVEKIWGGSKVSNSLEDITFGYGIAMKGLETGRRYVYWHCLPIFPVWAGDRVKRGKIAAFMGNAGNVTVGGAYVPAEARLNPEKPGTHLHEVVQINGVPIDPLSVMDVTTEPIYTNLDLSIAMMMCTVKILKLLVKGEI